VNNTLIDMLGKADPRAAAIRDPSGTVLTYGELEQQSTRLALGLVGAGVGAGDRVAYQVQKSPSALVVHVALLRCGAIQVPLNPDYSDQEVRALLDDAAPVMLIRPTDREVLPGSWQTMTLDADGGGSLWSLPRDGAEALPQSAPDDGAALLYTSGTTGRPKGALLSHANLAANAETLVGA